MTTQGKLFHFLLARELQFILISILSAASGEAIVSKDFEASLAAAAAAAEEGAEENCGSFLKMFSDKKCEK